MVEHERLRTPRPVPRGPTPRRLAEDRTSGGPRGRGRGHRCGLKRRHGHWAGRGRRHGRGSRWRFGHGAGQHGAGLGRLGGARQDPGRAEAQEEAHVHAPPPRLRRPHPGRHHAARLGHRRRRRVLPERARARGSRLRRVHHLHLRRRRDRRRRLRRVQPQARRRLRRPSQERRLVAAGPGGQELLRARGRRLRRHPARPDQQRHRRRHAGRLDDQPAVRRHGRRHPRRHLVRPQGPRGHHGDEAGAGVHQGGDPPALPEPQLLQPRRLRHRRGLRGLVRQEARGADLGRGDGAGHAGQGG